MSITMPDSMGRMLEIRFKRAPRLSAFESRANRLEKYLTTQHAITQVIAQSTELERALPRILQAICETTDWDFGEVWYVDRNDNQLYCAATWCSPSLRFPEFEKSGWSITFALGKGLPGRVWESDKLAWITNVIEDRNFLRAEVAKRDGLHGGLGIPIRSEGEVIGALTFFSRQPRQPDRELLQVLDTVGNQIGLFIARKRAEQVEREQARMLAVLEERQRLARDLHDSVTQTLFSASVIAEMLPSLWTNNPDQVRSNLDELHQLTRGALTEMRALLTELRPSALVNHDLAVLLKNLADALMNRTIIQVALDVQLSSAPPPIVQIALYRIVQEALNNIAKHADAKRVSVRLCGDSETTQLVVQDDGRGFDIASIPAAHFGIGIMRERAAEIGAAFDIASEPGKGTRLSVTYTPSAMV